MADLQPITKTCVPRDDVLQGGLTDAHFAAQLDRIVRDPGAYPAYGEPESFFALTYPTQGLRTLLARTFARISGAKVPGAEHGLIRSETSFGGGKTHGLIAAYHLAKGARPRNVAEFIDPSLLPDECQVAAVVGDQLDPIKGLVTNGAKTFTLWGEIAAQLGEHALEVLLESDEARTAPSKETLAQAFDGKPTIIIIDEIAQYLRMLTSSGDEGVRRLAGAVPVFLKNLLELAAGDTRVVVILTLATNQDAFGRETDDLTAVMSEAQDGMATAVKEATSVVGRFTSGGSIVKPAEDVEIAEILKRRLFERINETAAAAAGEAYEGFYEALAAKGEQLTGGADQPTVYRKRVERAYPFHPELIRVLDQRLGTIPNFQRARGALKLLAEVVAGMWRDGTDAAIINVGDIHYENAHVLQHVTTGLGRAEFESVAKVDILGQDAHATAVDTGRMHGKHRLTRRAGGTVFTHSLELQASAGAGRPEVVLGTLRPGESPDLVIEAINELDRRAWFLAYEHSRYRFNTEPSPNAIVAQAEESISATKVSDEARHRVEEAFPTDGPMTVIHFPTGPESVPDHPPKLRLVIVHHDDASVRSGAAAPPLVVEMLNKTGANAANRTNRNGVAFLLADTDAIDSFKRLVRRDLAAQSVANDTARIQTFSESVQKRVRGLADTAKLEARVALARCYRHLFVPSADKSSDYLKHEELSAAAQGDVQAKQTKVILEFMKDHGKVRTLAPSTDYLRSKAWPKDATEVTTEAIMGAFWIDHGVPLILDPTFLHDAIRLGVTNGAWVYYDVSSEKAYTSQDAPPSVRIAGDAFLYTPGRAQELGLTARAPRIADVTEALNSRSKLSGTDLRAAIEQATGKEPKKGDVLALLARAAEGGENAKAFVVQGDPVEGQKPLTPSDITKLGLDGLTILTRAEAEKAGLDLGRRTAGPRPVEVEGAIGSAFQGVLNQVEDAGWPSGIHRLSVTARAEIETGIKPVRELNRATTMLPQFRVDVDLSIDFTFANLENEGHIQAKGSAKDFQKVEDAIFKVTQVAEEVLGDLTLTIGFDPPLAPDDLKIEQVRKVLTALQPGAVKVKAFPQ